MRSSVSSPVLHDQFARINRDKPYAKQVKPFNFLLSASVTAHEWPPGAHALGGFHLISPYSRNPSEWLRSSWIDIHSGVRYAICTDEDTREFTVRVQTIADVIDHFRVHPEAKNAAPDGYPANSWTSGLLGRLDIHVLTAFHIGKESNLIEQQEEGVLIADPQVVYWGGGEWETVRPYLDRVSLSDLPERSGVSARRLREYRQGVRRPKAKTLGAIMEALGWMLDEGEG